MELKNPPFLVFQNWKKIFQVNRVRSLCTGNTSILRGAKLIK